MTKPFLIVEDTSAGLYLWAILNEFLFNRTFEVRFCNPAYMDYSIDVSSFKNNKLCDSRGK